MKRLLLTLAALAALGLSLKAQTDTNVIVAPTIVGGLEQIADAFGSQMPTNFVVGPYASCAIENNKLANWTVGLAEAYNFSKNVGVLLAEDYSLDNNKFLLITGQIMLKTEIHPLTFLGWSNFVAVPFGFAGVGTPIAGAGAANGDLASVAGAGAAINLFSVKDWQVGAMGAYANWSGAGAASGNRIYFGLGVGKTFGGQAKAAKAARYKWSGGV